MVLFLGGWHAPITLPWTINTALDPGSLNIGLPLLFFVVPVVGTLLLAAPIRLLFSRVSGLVALIIGFVLFNLVVGGLVFAWAYASFDWVAGLVGFLLKTYTFVFIFVLGFGTLAPGAHRPAHGLRLEMALAGVPAQPLRDRARDPARAEALRARR